MLRDRLIFGLLMIVGAVGVFWLDGFLEGRAVPQPFGESLFLPPGVVLLALMLLLLPFAASELSRILRAIGADSPPWLLGTAAVAAALTLYAAAGNGERAAGPLLATVLGCALLLALVWHGRKGRPEGALRAAGAVLLGAVYLGMLGGLYLAMRHHHTAWVVLAVILVVKCGDIGAYVTGRAIGRRKLIPWLSPGKTWEGLAGGLFLATAVAAALALLSHQTALAGRPFHVGWTALGGAALALVGHLGDLMVSLFKRDAGVKDSGRLVPGSGGVLDVLDSPLLAAPVAYWMLEVAAAG